MQEAGRAGRDGAPAHCLLLYTPGDVVRVSRLINMKGKGSRFKKKSSVDNEERKLGEMRKFCEDTVRFFFSLMRWPESMKLLCFVAVWLLRSIITYCAPFYHPSAPFWNADHLSTVHADCLL